VFTVITPDIGETVFMPRILAYVQAHAPHIASARWRFRRKAPARRWSSGQADLAIGYFPDLAKPGFYQQRLFKNSFVCMVRADHPRIGDKLTVDEFMKESHALVRPAGRTHLFEQFLNTKNIKLDVRAELSHFASLLTIISSSDLIATVPRDIGHVFATLAKVQAAGSAAEAALLPSDAALAYGGACGFGEHLAQADGQGVVRGLTGAHPCHRQDRADVGAEGLFQGWADCRRRCSCWYSSSACTVDQRGLDIGALHFDGAAHQAFDGVGDVVRLVQHVGRV
jgi:hypothetical protein